MIVRLKVDKQKQEEKQEQSFNSMIVRLKVTNESDDPLWAMRFNSMIVRLKVEMVKTARNILSVSIL